MTELRSGSSERTEADPDQPRRTPIVWALAAAAALGAVLSGAEPTASPVADAVLAAGAAVVVVYLASQARPWAGIVTAGLAALSAQSGPALVMGGTALAVAVAGVIVDRHHRVIGALVGALAVQALFRLPDWDPQGMATAVALVAVAPVVVSGYRNCAVAARRGLLIGPVVLVVLALALSALAGVMALGQRNSIEAGIEQARAGLQAAENGDTTEARRLLSAAEQSFEGAADTLGVAWLTPATGVPVVGQNVEALSVAAEQGAELASTAGTALLEADLETLRFDQGAIDLDRVRSIGPPLERSAAALGDSLDELSAANSSWLLPPVGDRYDDFRLELADAAADADVAVDAVAVAPSLLGADGDRRYLVLFTTPAEMRGLGGFIGNFGVLSAVDGDLELTRSGRIQELKPAPDAPPYTISGPADYVERWGRYEPGRFVQDITFSPDFPSVAQVWEEIYPQTPGGTAIDGVIVVDPYALAALMTFTGPITVPGYPTPLTRQNAADILLREQYLTFAEDGEARIDFLDDATRLTFEALTRGDIPGPREVTDVLGPMVAQGRLLMHSLDPDEQGFFTRVNLDGALPAVEDDFLSVTTQNSGFNKIDIFLHRAIRYDVTYDPDRGTVEAEVTVTLRNDAPATGLPSVVIGNRDPEHIPIGANQMYVSVYTPWDVVAATRDGEAIPVGQAEELDRRAYGFFAQVPPGGRRTITLTLQGALDPAAGYSLTFAPQPLVNPDALSIRVRGADGWRVCGTHGLEQADDEAVADLVPEEDLTVNARFVLEPGPSGQILAGHPRIR